MHGPSVAAGSALASPGISVWGSLPSSWFRAFFPRHLRLGKTGVREPPWKPPPPGHNAELEMLFLFATVARLRHSREQVVITVGESRFERVHVGTALFRALPLYPRSPVRSAAFS